MEQNATVLGAGLYALDRDALAALAQSLCRQLTERGAYHGGIRPENLGFDGRGEITLGQPVGDDVNREWTPAELEYMAPEVFWNGTRTPSADVYALGMLLYAGVTGGHLPFTPANATDEERAEALRRRMSGEALPIPKTAGKHLGAVIDKATQFRLDDRYESPEALSQALSEAREAIRDYVPPAREMLDKPYQELTEMERMLLAVLTEKAEAERRAAEEAERLAAEEAARQEAERRAAEEAVRQEAGRKTAEEARQKAEAEAEAEPESEPSAPEADAEEAGSDEVQPEPKPEVPAEPAQEPPAESKTVKKPGVDPALVEAISASVAARMAQSETPVKDTPTVPPGKQAEEAERISRQLEQMEWIGHNRDRSERRSGWIVLLLCAIALVLGALILHSIGAIGAKPRPTPLLPEETPFESMLPGVEPSAEVAESAEPTEPVESAEPTATPEPTPTPTPKPKFEFVKSNASWETAKAEAEAKGGHLAVISSAEDLQAIADLASAQGVRYVWVGLSRDASGALQWVSENASPYVVWASGEPSGRDSYTGQPENYVLIANNAGTWSFNDCGNDPAAAYPRFYSGVLGYVIQYD